MLMLAWSKIRAYTWITGRTQSISTNALLESQSPALDPSIFSARCPISIFVSDAKGSHLGLQTGPQILALPLFLFCSTPKKGLNLFPLVLLPRNIISQKSPACSVLKDTFATQSVSSATFFGSQKKTWIGILQKSLPNP